MMWVIITPLYDTVELIYVHVVTMYVYNWYSTIMLPIIYTVERCATLVMTSLCKENYCSQFGFNSWLKLNFVLACFTSSTLEALFQSFSWTDIKHKSEIFTMESVVSTIYASMHLHLKSDVINAQYHGWHKGWGYGAAATPYFKWMLICYCLRRSQTSLYGLTQDD